MYQVCIVESSSHCKEYVLEHAGYYFNVALLETLRELSWQKAKDAMALAQAKALALYPIHVVPGTKGDMPPAYYVVVRQVTGAAQFEGDTQFIFCGERFAKLFDDDTLRRMVNVYARMPANRLNRAEADQLAGTILGSFFDVIPPMGVDSVFTATPLAPTSMIGEPIATCPREALLITTKITGMLSTISELEALMGEEK